MPKKRCVVIGGGLAGLSAALKLVQQGWSVKVFEAQERLGGRVRSHYFDVEGSRHLICELGAEWIGTSHTRMLELCHRFRLEPEPHQYSTTFWMKQRPGRKVYYPEAATLPRKKNKDYEDFLDWFKSASFEERRPLDNRDWWTELRRIGLRSDQLRQREHEDGTDFGESIRMTSAYVAASEYAFSNYTDELDFKVPRGNSRLVTAMARAIKRGGGKISCEAVVTAIRQHKDDVALTVRGRPNPVRADICICAVPSTRLRYFTWSPAPEEHLYAAEQLQYSRITKTAVLYDQRFWRRPKKGKRGTGFAVFTNRVADFCFDSTFGIQTDGPGILCSYSFGEKAANITGESRHQLAKWIQDDVLRAQRRKPMEVPHQKHYQVESHPWHEDRWARGAYAFYRPGQWFAIRPILQRPFGRVLFAGEHLAEESGFMESAVRSGEAMASAV